LTEAVERAVTGSGLAAESVHTRTADLDLGRGALGDADAARALAFVVERFSEADDEEVPLTTLSEGLHAAMARTVARFDSLNQLIERGEMKLVFQPIAALAGSAIDHYEVLSRFPSGQSPHETIAYSEEVGLIQELDLAVCRKVIDQLDAAREHSLAVNISGRSIQTDAFRGALQGLLDLHKSVAPRLILELSEASAVASGNDAALFLKHLRTQGFRLCLEDFGVDSTALAALRQIEVDFVKIDGPFLKAATPGSRDAALLASICRLCKDLGCRTIAAMIESEADADRALAFGIDFGQGWRYGRPLDALPAPKRPRLSSLGTR
jgi:EAL domain-containing protein (putative c-di-GMP-specific phosphodiesterase class I)